MTVVFIVTWQAVGERKAEGEAEETMHSDSTESVVEDPLEVCEKNLLSHILRVQADISDKLDKIEEEVTSKSPQIFFCFPQCILVCFKTRDNPYRLHWCTDCMLCLEWKYMVCTGGGYPHDEVSETQESPPSSSWQPWLSHMLTTGIKSPGAGIESHCSARWTN